MKRIAISMFALAAVACGGGEPAADDSSMETTTPAPAAEAPATGEMTMPDWYTMDGNNVTLNITAGSTDVGNYWNFNGRNNGNMTISVPVGATVTINFNNADPNMPHSVGIAPAFTGAVPAAPAAEPVFEGAITSGATVMADATQPGESETITFTASEAGEYTMLCYVPAHGVSGMWVKFVVSADGEAGAMMM